MMTDPIADFLTRIRNASLARHDKVAIPRSRLKLRLAEILKEEGYISDFSVGDESLQGSIELALKYGEAGKPLITGLKRESKPGLRVYVGKEQVPRVLNGMGIAILTTSRGVMTDRDARLQNIGGEVICTVW